MLNMYVILFSSGYTCRTYASPDDIVQKAQKLCESYAKYYNVTHEILEVKCELI